jgi:hypothetical protein
MKNKIIVLFLLLFLILGMTSCDSSDEDGTTNDDISEKVYEYKDLSKAEAKDKILGGWIGHALGVGSGFEYVVATNNVCEIDGSPVDGFTVDGKTAIIALHDKYWEPDGQICAGSIGSNPYRVRPVNDPRVVRGTVYSDDDMHIDILNQFIFRDYGPVLGNNDIASAWEFYDVHDVGGGSDTRNLVLNSSFIPPYTGQSTYGSMGYWVTESWIENETVGMLFPYMYELAEGYADMFTQVQGDAYGYYSVVIEGIRATEFDNNYDIFFFDKEGKQVGVISYSVQMYVYDVHCNVHHNNKPMDIEPLTAALWNYYHAAEDYIDEFIDHKK